MLSCYKHVKHTKYIHVTHTGHRFELQIITHTLPVNDILHSLASTIITHYYEVVTCCINSDHKLIYIHKNILMHLCLKVLSMVTPTSTLVLQTAIHNGFSLSFLICFTMKECWAQKQSDQNGQPIQQFNTWYNETNQERSTKLAQFTTNTCKQRAASQRYASEHTPCNQLVRISCQM